MITRGHYAINNAQSRDKFFIISNLNITCVILYLDVTCNLHKIFSLINKHVHIVFEKEKEHNRMKLYGM